MAFLNTGMWVAGEKLAIRPHACVHLHRSRFEDAKHMTKTRFKRKEVFTEVEESSITGFS